MFLALLSYSLFVLVWYQYGFVVGDYLKFTSADVHEKLQM